MRIFDSWQSVAATATAGIVAYIALVTFLRVAGKRTLAKMSAFDLVVTVALGSTLGSVLTSNTLPLVNGILALALLIALQYAVAWLNIRADWFRRLVKSEPTLLFEAGDYRGGAMTGARVGRDEVLAAIRGAGLGDLAGVSAVVLETDGSFSVLPLGAGADAGRSSLADVGHG